jgi:Xaa-Pro aminopeptidase
MVLTIEPGLYVAPGAREAPPELRGLGIRIEDDVLVTREGREVLTAGVPKDPEEIESLMATGRSGAPGAGPDAVTVRSPRRRSARAPKATAS